MLQTSPTICCEVLLAWAIELGQNWGGKSAAVTLFVLGACCLQLDRPSGFRRFLGLIEFVLCCPEHTLLTTLLTGELGVRVTESWPNSIAQARSTQTSSAALLRTDHTWKLYVPCKLV